MAGVVDLGYAGFEIEAGIGSRDVRGQELDQFWGKGLVGKSKLGRSLGFEDASRQTPLLNVKAVLTGFKTRPQIVDVTTILRLYITEGPGAIVLVHVGSDVGRTNVRVLGFPLLG